MGLLIIDKKHFPLSDEKLEQLKEEAREVIAWVEKLQGLAVDAGLEYLSRLYPPEGDSSQPRHGHGPR